MTVLALAQVVKGQPAPPLRLRLDGAALVANWRRVASIAGGAACGAAVKADGYGLGAAEVASRLARAGCRDFFVSSWVEAAALEHLPAGCSASVLHGVRAEDMEFARASRARPVLVTAAQVARWRATGLPCDVMVDTGINRLGITVAEARSGLLDGLRVETLISHLACADEPAHPTNRDQPLAFQALGVGSRRRSLANSAGAFLGPDFAFDLVRPGLALYGGRVGRISGVRPVASLEAQVLQVRNVRCGEGIGYGLTWIAARRTRIAVLAAGYADGLPRAFGPSASAYAGDWRLPVVGRISMDQLAVDLGGEDVGEGDWLRIPFDLAEVAAATDRSQYEVLTGLGRRFERRWSD